MKFMVNVYVLRCQRTLAAQVEECILGTQQKLWGQPQCLECHVKVQESPRRQ